MVELEGRLVEVEIDGGPVRRSVRRRRGGEIRSRLFRNAGDGVVDALLGGRTGGPNHVDVPLQGGVQLGAEVC